MSTHIKWIIFGLLILSPLRIQAQFIFYIGTDRKADKAQRETTAILSGSLEEVISMQKKMYEAEDYLNFELGEQEAFLMKRYPSEQQIDAYIKDNPLVKKIFKERFAKQELNLKSLYDYIQDWKYAPFFKKSLENIQNDMDDTMSQWKQATEISGNSNRMSNAQRNSLMEETLERFKQICVTTQQLKATMQALSMRDKENNIKPNASGKIIE